MESLHEKKQYAVEAINDLLLVVNNLESEDSGFIDELNKKNECINQMNKKLISEISEKDKLISVQHNTISDYEKQINAFSKVKEEENKFAILKAKDKENSNLNKEILSLKKELEQVNSKLELISGNNIISCEVEDVEESTTDNIDEELSVPVNEESTISKAVVKDVEVERYILERAEVEVEVEKVKVEEEVEVEKVKVEEEVVVKDVVKGVVKDVEVEEGEEEGEEELSDIVWVSKKYKGNRYYVEKDNPNSKMYEMLEGELVGEEVGEMINGKKKLYK